MSGTDGHSDGDGACPSMADLALLRQWNQLQGAFRRLNGRLLDDVEASTGVSPSAFQALWYLVGSPERTAKMSQLSAILGFSTAGTTKVADRLAEAGMIERGPSAADRRVILVTLTEHGMTVASEAIRTFLGALRERAVEPMGPDGFAELVTAVVGLDPGGGGEC
ncbi:DNA-binding MarR family transcriptional regulator [Catenulispora sp. EB89]|uniref:MarR family winged helix-turn-helix transcriptional regulator n=1 Tax=Catenulispora sp. EB89 TaxID=3156257 RepID=UPI003513B5BF